MSTTDSDSQIAAPGSWSRASLPLALFLLLGCGILQIVAGYSHEVQGGNAWGADDAYISYRYAHNLASGQGLVYNPGERVEGFSNLLYVLLLAPLEALAGRDRIYFASAGINLLFALATVLLLYRFARTRLGERGAGWLALLVALCPPLWVAVASGLETPLILLLQMALWILTEGVLEEPGRRAPARRLCAVAALSVLARADGFLVPLLAATYLALRGRRRAGRDVALTTLAVFAALAAFRLAYYGWLLPNTVYAKVDGPLALRLESGVMQLTSTALATGLLFYLAVFALAAFRVLRHFSFRQPDPFGRLPFPVFFAAAWLGYFLYIGGDIYNERFLLFLFPLGAYLLIPLLAEIRRPRSVALLAVLVVALQLAPLRSDPRFSYNGRKYDCWVLLGRYLGTKHPGALLATEAAGKIPYFSGLRTLDMLGLTDLHIAHLEPEKRGYFRVAHNKSDLPYILSRHPDLIAAWPMANLTLGGAEPNPAAKLRWAGYRLAYLVNTSAQSREPNIADVRAWTDEAIKHRMKQNYYFGVYERQPAPIRNPAGR